MFKSLNKAISTPIAIIIVIIVAILAVGAVLVYQYYWQPQTAPAPPEPSADETANWKTYRNEEYGYEIKYPQNLQKKEISDAVSFSALNKDKRNIEDFIFMIFYSKDLKTEIKDRRKELFNSKTFRTENAKEEEILLDNITATKLSAKIFSLLPELNFEYSDQIDIFIGEDKNLHIFGFISPENESEYLIIFDQMLSTFRFLE